MTVLLTLGGWILCILAGGVVSAVCLFSAIAATPGTETKDLGLLTVLWGSVAGVFLGIGIAGFGAVKLVLYLIQLTF